MPMTSHDVISTIEGVGCVTEEGVCHGKFKLDNFHMISGKSPTNLLETLSNNSVDISYLIFNELEASLC